jgi:glutathione S-transferase
MTLVSHALCPYVQRAAIMLLEKGVPFERRSVDLADKPAWFSAVSPLGKTPVLLVGDAALFESAAICEYLDESFPPRLHPADALQRARHRAWMEFGSSMLNTIWAFYTAPDAASLHAQREQLRSQFARIEAELEPAGPWFAGDRFTVVDAVFAPVFRYFDAFEALGNGGWFDTTPRVRSWRTALAGRASVQQAVSADYPERLLTFLRTRGSELSRRLPA